ncbi:hypothetical protein Plec18167_004590 [Paecilomyces lecythidis]|uniref:Conserved oligomeric Golgi complex subunit 8 n=1 Tax=Paecilomyces lecythidis TaxID=3004212 RepID=A0ABR3XPV8_9EURO
MTDALYELLAPYLDAEDTSARPAAPQDATTSKYLNRLSTLSVQSLKETEPQSLAQSSHSTLLSLQALSNRSHKAFITSTDNLSTLRTSIPRVGREVRQLRDAIPKLDEEAVRFSSTYSKTVENPIIERRKKAMQLARNVDRLSDILELPTLLSTAVSSASASANTAAPSSTNYSSALDLYAHIKRLQTLYPDSSLVRDVALQAEDAMKDMTTNLLSSLRSQNIRLAAAMRTVGWLRRVAPELEGLRKDGSTGASEGALGAIFLISRLANLISTLEALDPLRELADQETRRRSQSKGNKSDPRSSGNTWSGGHQTERYLKRYIEIYREQTFAIVSLYKNIFTPEQSDSDFPSTNVHLRTQITSKQPSEKDDPLQILPPALATLPMHLVTLLTETLRTYLPNVQDKSSRESLLTQVLYCAGSLGRLGGDFGMILTLLDDSEEGDEGEITYDWEEVMRKHRALAGRLEQLTGGSTGAGGKGVSRVASPVH